MVDSAVFDVVVGGGEAEARRADEGWADEDFVGFDDGWVADLVGDVLFDSDFGVGRLWRGLSSRTRDNDEDDDEDDLDEDDEVDDDDDDEDDNFEDVEDLDVAEDEDANERLGGGIGGGAGGAGRRAATTCWTISFLGITRRKEAGATVADDDNAPGETNGADVGATSVTLLLSLASTDLDVGVLSSDSSSSSATPASESLSVASDLLELG